MIASACATAALCPGTLKADPQQSLEAPPTGIASGLPPKAEALKPPVLQSASAILIDAVSGQVLYELNADVQRPMASTTKIMTALLFCESVPDDAIVVASDKACKVRDSSLHLKVGEKLKAHDLLRAILMRSANDGCVAGGECAAGSEAAFVERMNTKAIQIGALHTHFMNPHGLHDPKHYSTARDLATIGRAAMKVPRIEEVVRTQKIRIDRSIDKKDVTMRNHSHFLGRYPGADGIKTGWTIPAGHCYVGSATVGGWRLITVVLKSKDYVKDTAALMSYGFQNFETHVIARSGEAVGVSPVSGGQAATVPAIVSDTVQFVTRKGVSPQIEKRIHLDGVPAPVEAGKTVGSMEVLADGKPVAAGVLVAGAASPAISALQSLQSDNPWKRFAFTTTIFAVGLVSLRYGTRYGSRIAAIAKGARRRRRRVAPKLRGDDRRG